MSKEAETEDISEQRRLESDPTLRSPLVPIDCGADTQGGMELNYRSQ